MRAIDKKKIIDLARHRVKKQDIVKELPDKALKLLGTADQIEYQRSIMQQATNNYYALEMTQDEILERRAYLRRMLRKTRFNDLKNEELDSIRLYQVPGYGFMLEDTKGYETIIPDGEKFDFGEFRKACAMVPFEYKDKMAKDFRLDCYDCDTTDLKNIVNKFIGSFENFRNEGFGLYIQSRERGSGKTLLASILVNEISTRYAVNTKFVTIYDYLEMTKKGYHGSPEEIQAINSAQVLVLDDFGAHMAKEWIESVLFSLIDKRTIQRLVTIYTSNIPLEELNIDGRILDRIKSRSYILKVPDVSIRNREASQRKIEFMKETEKHPHDTAISQGHNIAEATR